MRVKVYTESIRSCLLYGCETWAMRAGRESKMERTEMRMIRWMCRVSLKERQPSTELRRCIGIEALGRCYEKRQTGLAWTREKKG